MLIPTHSSSDQPTLAMIAAEKCLQEMAEITEKLSRYTLRLEKETKELISYRETMVAENRQLIEQAKKNAEEIRTKQMITLHTIKAFQEKAEGSLASMNSERAGRIETLVKQAQDEKALLEKEALEVARLQATIAHLQ